MSVTAAGCVFAKPPRAGEAKTRLAPVLGWAGAAQLAAALLCDVWGKLTCCSWATPVLATTELAGFPVAVAPAQVWLQGDGDLGARQERILSPALTQYPSALALGADTPLLTTAHLHEAAALLASHDAVVGPCPDGGYYLLGVKACPPGLLAGLPWSCEQTTQALLARLTSLGWRVAQLEALPDLDVPADLHWHLGQLDRLQADAPATARFLEAYVPA